MIIRAKMGETKAEKTQQNRYYFDFNFEEGRLRCYKGLGKPIPIESIKMQEIKEGPEVTVVPSAPAQPAFMVRMCRARWRQCDVAEQRSACQVFCLLAFVLVPPLVFAPSFLFGL